MKMKKEVCNAYMETAKNFAKCSTAKRLQVGSIIVDPATGAIISVGYNGMPSGMSNVCEEKRDGELRTKDAVLHAEENAIAKLARSSSSSEGTWMFITHSPCIKCARLIISSGIAKVFYNEQFKGTIGCGLDLLRKGSVKTIHIGEKL
jgi:dCMP deaminase